MMHRSDFLAGAAMPAAPERTSGSITEKLPVVLGQIDLSFHSAAAGVVAHILHEDGVPLRIESALHEAMFAKIQAGEMDLLCSAWLPGSHGKYIQPMEQEIEALGVLYEPYVIWGVPDYIPEAAVSSIGDLLKPEVSNRMRKVIQGIGPGAGVSRFSREIMRAYGLEAMGYEFRNGTQKDCEDAFIGGVGNGEWLVVPLWHPQWLHYKYKIRALNEPKGLLRGKDKATLIVRRDRMHKIPPATVAALRRMTLGNEAVAYLDYLINVERLDELAAAGRWIGENKALVEKWRA